MQIVHFEARSWEILLLFVIGGTLAWLVAKKPRMFWPLLIVVNLVGIGPTLMKYFFWDKALTAFIILGALSRKRGDKHHVKSAVRASDYSVLFNVWIGYMIVESIIGVIANSDVRIVFWVFFYAMLGLLSSILYRRGGEFPFPSIRQFSIIALTTVLVYNIALLAYGVIVEQVLGLEAGRYAAQFVYRDTFVWAPPSISSYPSIVGIPAAVFAMNDRSFGVRVLALLSASVMAVAAFYYDSRAAYSVIAVGLVLSLGRMRVSGVLALAAIFITVFSYNMGSTAVNNFLKTEVLESAQFVWSPSERDLPRQKHTVAGFLRVTDNVRTFFVGDGFYSHKVTIIPAMEKANEDMPGEIVPIKSQELRNDDFLRTNAFTALLIDTGVIGMLMLIALFLRCALRVIVRKGPNRAILVSTLILAFAWQFSVNTTGLLLFYLLFMPLGLVERLSREGAAVRARTRMA